MKTFYYTLLFVFFSLSSSSAVGEAGAKLVRTFESEAAMFNAQCSMFNALYSYPYLAFETADGNALTVAVDGLTFTLDDTTLTATDSEGNAYTFALSSLSKMYFTDEATAIQPLRSDSAEKVEVFCTDGTSAGCFANVTAARAALSPGVYVLKGKHLTLKLSVR